MTWRSRLPLIETFTASLRTDATLLSRWSRNRAAPGILTRMGFNPYRKFVAKRADYVFVAAAVAAVIGLLAWVLLG
jgi:hypothetical protein